jgi:hypothetical protein
MTDADAEDLIHEVVLAAANRIMEMREAGGSPADMMTALTQVNIAIFGYVFLAAEIKPNINAMIRDMAKILRTEVPRKISQYEAAVRVKPN